MRIGGLAAAALAAALAWAAAGSAAATIHYMTFKGVLGAGSIDDAGMFGAPSDVSGQQIKVTFRVDDANPFARPVTPAGGGSGVVSDFHKGVIFADVTVNGATFTYDSEGAQFTRLFNLPEVNVGGQATYYHDDGVQALSGVVIGRVSSFEHQFVDTPDYRDPLFYRPTDGDGYGVSLNYNIYDYATGRQTQTLLAFDPTLVTVSNDDLSGADGQSADTPLLPVDDAPGGGFAFDFPVTPDEPVFIDPAVASGYNYTLASGSPLIATALFPTIPGDADGYQIYALGDLTTPLFTGVMGGQTIDFRTLPGYANGIRGFALRGIDLAAGLDPDNPTAFVTQLTFASAGDVRLAQTPVKTNVGGGGGGAPEPGTWALMVAGFGLAGARLRRRAIRAA